MNRTINTISYTYYIDDLYEMYLLKSENNIVKNCLNMATLLKITDVIESKHLQHYEPDVYLNIGLYICYKYDLWYSLSDNEKKIYFDTIAKCASILCKGKKFDVKKDDNYNYSYIIRYDDKINFKLTEDDDDDYGYFEEI